MDHSSFYWNVGSDLHCKSFEIGEGNCEETLPIDIFLDRWIAGEFRPRVDPRRIAYFSLVGGGSLRAWIRSYLAWTFKAIADFDPSRREIDCRHLQQLRGDAARLLSEVEQFHNSYTRDLRRPFMLPEQSRSEHAAHMQFLVGLNGLLADVMKQLASLGSDVDLKLDAIAPIGGGRPPLRWRRYFVGSMANAWMLLTGSLPKANAHGRFSEFVECAWYSGDENLPSVSWEQSLRSLSVCVDEYEQYELRLYSNVDQSPEPQAA